MTKAWLAPGLLPAYIHCSIDYPFHVYAHWTGQQRPLKGSLMQRLNGHPNHGLLAWRPLLLSPLWLPPHS